MTKKTICSSSRNVKKKVFGPLLFTTVFTCLPLLCEGKSSAVIESVYTHSQDKKSRVEIRLSRATKHKIIPLDDSEIIIAIKDAVIDENVLEKEVIIGDPFVRQVLTAQKPSQVASVIVQLSKSLKDMDYRVEKRNEALRLELRNKKRSQNSIALKQIGSASDTGLKTANVAVPEKSPSVENKAPIREDNEPKTPDAHVLRDAEREMQLKNWESALVTLEELLSSYPDSPYQEDALFLIATCYHESHLENIQEHLFEITERYQVAINKFPKSRFVPKALASMGHAYFAADRYHEAMANYDRVLNEFDGDPAIAEVMVQRGLVYASTKRPLLALREFEKVRKRFPNSPVAPKAMLEEAKTLFHIKSFKRSLKVLAEIRQKDATLAKRDPDVLLYEGYNFYELGQLQEAREALSTALNLFTDLEEVDLLLTRIADTYREDGMEDKATKIYDLVARTYPLSEGSLISLLRIAEGLENTGILEEANDSEEKDEEEMTSKRANDIYQQIIDRAPESPLAQVAMLKLATFQKKNKQYDKAIETLKKLLAKEPNHKLKKQVLEALQDAMYWLAIGEKERNQFEKSIETFTNLLSDFPDTYLKDDVKPALQESLTAVFADYQKMGNPENMVRYYERLKPVLPFNQMPTIMLDVANAYKSLHLYGHAYDTLLQAKNGMGNNEFPPEYLLSFAHCAYEERQLEQARKSLHAFISNYPNHEDLPIVHFWLGKVHLSEKDYATALKAFRAALLRGIGSTLKTEALFAMAEAAAGQGNMSTAAETLEKAVLLVEYEKENGKDNLFSVYRRLGEVYGRLGQKEKAVAAFEKALKSVSADTHPYGLQYQLAQCYQKLKKPVKAEKLLKEIEAAGDPFWSRLARAQIEEITISRTAQNLGIGGDKS